MWNNTDALDKAANLFIPENDISKLTYEEQTRARNLTSAIFSLPVEGLDLSFVVSANGSEITTVRFPNKTDVRGEFNQFVSTQIDGVDSESKVVQRLELHTNISDGKCLDRLPMLLWLISPFQWETVVCSLSLNKASHSSPISTIFCV